MVDAPDSRNLLPLDELDPRRRRLLIARSIAKSVGALAAMLVVYYIAPWDGGRPGSVALRISLSLVIVVLLTVAGIGSVAQAEWPLLKVTEALSAVVGLAVLSFASAYVVLSVRDAAAFSEPLARTDALYFSLTTATTVGFGDIAAKSEIARIVVMIQMVTNIVVIGIAARVLVHAARRRAAG